jgi:hypothetical protein
MALNRNGSLNLSGLNRHFGQTGAYGLRGNFDKTGAHRNFGAGWHTISGVTALAGWPSGYRAGAWMLPQKPGAMRAGETDMTIGATGSGALGVNLVSTIGVSLGVAAIGGLISGGVANATISMGLSADIEATIGSTVTGSITVQGAGVISALGWPQAAATLTVNGAAVGWGLGFMTATTEEAGLTPTGVANAVWSKILEAGFPAGDIMRILAAHAAGPATGLEGATVEFRSLDGSKARIQGTYAGGTRGLTDLDGSA